jgi:copper chaperone
MKMEHVTLTIEGMICEHCVRAVKGRLEDTPGVKVEAVDVGTATLEFDPAKTTLDDIEMAIADEGYTAFVAEESAD